MLNIPQKNTRTEILTHLLGDDMTALDLKEKVGINENAVRKHLRRLENSDFVEHYFEKASRGRPKKYHSITERGRRLFPKHHLFLLNELLEQVDEVLDEKELEHLFEKVSEPYKKYLTLEKNSDFEEQVNELTQKLEALNFICDHSKKDDHHKIEYMNCIFLGISDSYKELVCGMHEDMIESSFDEDIHLERCSSILKGDNKCIHLIKR